MKTSVFWWKCTSVHMKPLLEIRSKTQTQLKFRHKLTKSVSSTSSLNKTILTQNAKNRKIQETWITRNRLMIVKSILTKTVQLSSFASKRWFIIHGYALSSVHRPIGGLVFVQGLPSLERTRTTPKHHGEPLRNWYHKIFPFHFF